MRFPESISFRLFLQKFVEDFVRRYVNSPHNFHSTVDRYARSQNHSRPVDRKQGILPLMTFNETPWISGTPIPENKRSLYVSRLVDRYSKDCVTVKNINRMNRMQLLDLLPIFMHLCGEALVQPAVGFKCVTNELLDLAAEFMVQSVLEQYMVYGAVGTEKLNETFSWREEHLEVCSSHLQFNDVATNRTPFHIDRDHKSSHLDSVPRNIIWASAAQTVSLREERSEYLVSFLTIHQITPPNGVSLVDHLENLAAKNPITDFEDKLLEFLETLQYSQAMPILSQVERGKVDGLTVADTEALKRRIGWPTMVERRTDGLSVEDGDEI